MRKLVSMVSAVLFAAPFVVSAQYYYSYPAPVNYGYHNFSPTTYIDTSPYVSVNVPKYAYQSSYASSYPWYSYSYPAYSYSYPIYYDSAYYPDYSYSSWYDYSPSYPHTYDYWWNDPNEYCYSGYGCYPMPVDDPHQWIYDHWTGNWY